VNNKTFSYLLILYSILYLGCKEKTINDQISDPLFTLTENKETGINFRNDLPYTEDFNTYTYRNFYNGGGVATGDINNDGLLDVYCTGNITGSKLFLNKGNWKFEDITNTAQVGCKNMWSTGASMVDINGDGLLDIYVCKAGKPGGERRYNELFINNGDLTFSEQSKAYGLDITGLSIHAAFLDYDKDGDLDCYILNNSIRSVGAFDFKEGLRNIPSPDGNKFLRNDNGKFVDISKSAGIYTSAIGYGLGITVSDFNNDTWPDLFISNDFFERDYLYINNQEGGFQEQGDKSFTSMSMGSMGADAADLDNDMSSDLFVTEMLPSSLERKKTKNIYETWDKHSEAVSKGYHYQFSRNVLQKNQGDGNFFEVGRYAGVSATDWSWAALIQDFDNDGLKDIFVSNGQYKDLLDRDYLNFSADEARIRKGIMEKRNVIMELIDSMPSQPIKNCMFHNEGSFTFKNVSDEWGLSQKTFSNGSAYGDLDNDGDLDLLVNNANMDLSVYKNNTEKKGKNFIQIKLKGSSKNTQAIGAKIILSQGGKNKMIENFSSRGFESSVADKLTIGLGDWTRVDTVKVLWPQGSSKSYTDLVINKMHILEEPSSNEYKSINNKTGNSKSIVSFGDFIHKEHDVNLFTKERMLVEMNGFDGPALAVGDVNGDKIEDVFIGGAKNQNSELYLSSGTRYIKVTKPFEVDVLSEKVKAKFFDSDGDGDLDLYVAHGGKNYSAYSTELNDALYINDGKGNFEKNQNFTQFPILISTGNIVIADINQDRKLDIILSEKHNVDFYGTETNIAILYNQGGNKYSCEIPASLKGIGINTTIDVGDLNNDGWQDIVVAGKWSDIKIFYNNKGRYNTKPTIIDNTCGLWNTVKIADIDGNGTTDVIGGNEGLNSQMASKHRMFIADFDQNGEAEQIICANIDDKYYPIHDNDEMFSQMPSLKKKYLYHRDMAKASIDDLFNKTILKEAKSYELNELRSIALINDGKNGFEKKPLPNEIQFSSVHAIYTQGREIYLGGNHYKVKPQFGRQDASRGWYLSSVTAHPKNLKIDGQIREIIKKGNKLLFVINNIGIKELEI
jgi:enediyne biosynthesis protein E4